MAGPADKRPADKRTTGQGRLRASHADREHVIEVLKAAFTQGRLTKDEFDLRVGRAFAAPTSADLATVTADIPVWLAGARSAGQPGRGWARLAKAVAWGLYGIIVPAVLWVAIVPGIATAKVMVTTAIVVYLICWLLGAVIMVAARLFRTRPGTWCREDTPHGHR